MTERAVQPFSSHTMTKAPKRQMSLILQLGENVTAVLPNLSLLFGLGWRHNPGLLGTLFLPLDLEEPALWLRCCDEEDGKCSGLMMRGIFFSPLSRALAMASEMIWLAFCCLSSEGKTPSALPAAFASVPSSLTLICTRMMKRKKRSCSSLVGWVPAAGSWDH